VINKRPFTSGLLLALLSSVVACRLATNASTPLPDHHAQSAVNRLVAEISAADKLECEVCTELRGFVRVGPIIVTDKPKMAAAAKELLSLRDIKFNEFGAGTGASPYSARLTVVGANPENVSRLRLFAGRIVVFGNDERYQGRLPTETLFALLHEEARAHAELHPNDVFRNE
jgi:hypothetical protein